MIYFVLIYQLVEVFASIVNLALRQLNLILYNYYVKEIKESLWCSVPVASNSFFLVEAIYWSPSSSSQNDVCLTNLIILATQSCKSHLLIMGCFNYPNIDWSTRSTSNSDVSNNVFLTTLQDNFLFQHVGSPTRYGEHTTPSKLDLVITNEESMISFIVVSEPLGKSDHVVLNFKYTCYSSIPVVNYNRYLFHKGDYESMAENLSNKVWYMLFKDLNTIEMWGDIPF